MPSITASAASCDSLRSDEEIWAQTQELARRFYALMGYQARPGLRFDLSQHPQELACWEMACLAQGELTNTDPRECEPED